MQKLNAKLKQCWLQMKLNTILDQLSKQHPIFFNWCGGSLWFNAMIGENRQLVTDEPIEFEK